VAASLGWTLFLPHSVTLTEYRTVRSKCKYMDWMWAVGRLVRASEPWVKRRAGDARTGERRHQISRRGRGHMRGVKLLLSPGHADETRFRLEEVVK
jgi:hypothetical protein